MLLLKRSPRAPFVCLIPIFRCGTQPYSRSLSTQRVPGAFRLSHPTLRQPNFQGISFGVSSRTAPTVRRQEPSIATLAGSSSPQYLCARFLGATSTTGAGSSAPHLPGIGGLKPGGVLPPSAPVPWQTRGSRRRCRHIVRPGSGAGLLMVQLCLSVWPAIAAWVMPSLPHWACLFQGFFCYAAYEEKRHILQRSPCVEVLQSLLRPRL